MLHNFLIMFVSKSLKVLYIFIAALLVMASSAQATDIQNIRFGQHADKIRMVIDLSKPSKAETLILNNPDRLVIDLSRFTWRIQDLKTPGFSKIRAVRHGQLENTGRIVLEFSTAVSVTSKFTLPPDGKGSGHRIIIDYKFGAETSQKSMAAPKPQTVALKAPIPPVKNAPKKGPKKAYKPLVFIDPGHGGIDPGAIAKNGVYEKHVTLQVARRLKRLLEKSGKYRVQMSRNSDIYLKLHTRVRKARQAEADLFISIHADSLDDKSVGGVSVYTLSDKASDAQTARLAERENKVDLIGGVDLTHEDADIANILIDLTMRDTLNQSKFFANTLVKKYQSSSIKTLRNPHRYAGFAVLKAPDIPSVLIECGFLSNPREAVLLTQAGYQEKVAKTLMSGIDAYFAKVEINQKT